MMMHPRARPRRTKPQGQPTRGKTGRNRLRRVDNFLLRYDPALLARQDGIWDDALFVDLGYGAEPFTTLESAARFRRVNSHLRVLGVEIDPARVAAAQPYADDRTHFRYGGFNLPLTADTDGDVRCERARLIRAFNVLRQYDESQVAAAYALMAQAMIPGGLLIEGTSDPLGRRWVAWLMRAVGQAGEAGWQTEGLVFSASFQAPFDPSEFQAVLPKRLIHRVVEGEPIYAFFAEWKRAAKETVAWRAWGERTWFVATAERLAEAGYAIDLRRRWLRTGYLIWKDAG